MNFDHDLFLLLNFDGGTTLDRVMLTLSGTTMWLPLYALILWLVWRRNGWQRTLLFCVLILLAVALADMVAGIFKHSGLLGGLCPDLEPRLRPMFTPAPKIRFHFATGSKYFMEIAKLRAARYFGYHFCGLPLL